jgi:hypothetical protein
MNRASDVLRAAGALIEVGWSQGAPARDGNGSPVPLHSGEVKAGVNPAAVSFSIYGAVCKALATAGPVDRLPLVWDVLYRLASASDTPHGGNNHVHPVIQFNEQEGRTKAEVLALLDLAAIECDRIGDGPFEPPVSAVAAGRAS